MTPLAVAAALALALLVGASMGLLGGGGAILTVPILTTVAGVEPRAAIAASLLVVGLTSTAALVPHARAGRVRWRIGAAVAPAAILGALAGGLLGGAVPPVALLLLLAATMTTAAVAMLRRRRREPRADTRPRTWLLLLLGLGVGVLSGLVGAGGGFLLVPALVLLAGLPTGVAAATSLLVIAVQTLAGLVVQPGVDDVPWALALPFAGLAIAASLVGATLTGRVPERALRIGFAILLLAVAAGLALQQLLHLLT
ncbi:sulfite exporter TauE/SafE family protein [Agrococcus terreus]|uniref:TSUP family transporter n=1 Tax=Agrococcus terreus TaxID=574649 RepID=UPI00384BF7D8